MDKFELRSYAKINLCLDVKGVLEGGFHAVEMVMQQILLCDDISVRWQPDNSRELDISLSTNRRYLPVDERNLAYKAALLMKEEYGQDIGGRLDVRIKKRIPVAAGLAGGSGNGAAMLHALNRLWKLGLDVSGLCETGSRLGSDVPFCVMGQAAENETLRASFADDPMACHCALATGRGTELKPLKGLKSDLVLSKPPISVSTAEVYKGIDTAEIPVRPDTDEMIEGLRTEDLDLVEKNMVNVLENFTLKRYPIVVYTKNNFNTEAGGKNIYMSGSGPTLFTLADTAEKADALAARMTALGYDSYSTCTSS